MKVTYVEPKDSEKYNVWFDHTGILDIWYEDTTGLDGYKDMDIPLELKEFLGKWKDKLETYSKKHKDKNDITESRIEFIYKDIIYSLIPSSLGFTSNSLLDKYQMKIREELEEQLNVIYSRYFKWPY